MEHNTVAPHPSKKPGAKNGGFLKPSWPRLWGWLEGYVKPLRRDTTYERYKSILERHVYPVFGKVAIDEIKRGDIRTLLLNLLKKGASRGTVCLVRDVISGPMVSALDDEIITANPVSGVFRRINAPRNPKKEIDPLNHEEVVLFL
jgi:hypothetical protein